MKKTRQAQAEAGFCIGELVAAYFEAAEAAEAADAAAEAGRCFLAFFGAEAMADAEAEAGADAAIDADAEAEPAGAAAKAEAANREATRAAMILDMAVSFSG